MYLKDLITTLDTFRARGIHPLTPVVLNLPGLPNADIFALEIRHEGGTNVVFHAKAPEPVVSHAAEEVE